MIFKADISQIFYRQGRNYDFWLGSLAKFPLSENSDKIRLTELAKNQTFPLFMTSLRLMLALQPPLYTTALGIFRAKPSATEKTNTNGKFATKLWLWTDTQRQTSEAWGRVWVIVENNNRMKWSIVVWGKNTQFPPLCCTPGGAGWWWEASDVFNPKWQRYNLAWQVSSSREKYSWYCSHFQEWAEHDKLFSLRRHLVRWGELINYALFCLLFYHNWAACHQMSQSQKNVQL